MTPTQSRAVAVASDQLREAFGDDVQAAALGVVRALLDEQTAARMGRAARLGDPGERDVFDEDCFEHWINHGHGSIGNAALTVLGLPCAHKFALPQMDGARSRCGKCGEHEPFSPAETPAAASVHRPVCHCGDYIDEHRGMSHNHGPVELLMGEDGRG